MKHDWNKIFEVAHEASWPVPSLLIQAAKPPHETARSIFNDERKEILEAAVSHGFKLIGPTTKVASFVKREG